MSARIGRRWQYALAGYALADGLYWVAVKPRVRRALGFHPARAGATRGSV